jgi:hypothetical protein
MDPTSVYRSYQSTFKQARHARAAYLERSWNLSGSNSTSPKELREVENDECVGGMHNSGQTPYKHVGWTLVGTRVQAAVDRILESFPEIELMVEGLQKGTASGRDGFRDSRQAREHSIEELGIENYQPTPEGVDIELIKDLGER